MYRIVEEVKEGKPERDRKTEQYGNGSKQRQGERSRKNDIDIKMNHIERGIDR